MEEKRTLSNDEIAGMNTLYYDLTTDLEQYRRVKRSRKFKKAIPEQQKSFKSQYRFFKLTLNSTLETLISQDGLNHSVAIDAMFNRFVSFKTKWAVSKYLRNKHSNK